MLEDIVWEETLFLLQNPQRIMDAYKFYLTDKNKTSVKKKTHK